jgi:hypothetical protein
MATVTAGYTWTSGETVTPAKLNSAAAPTVVVADNEVTTAKILDANVTAGKLAATLDLSGKTVTLPDDSVTDAKLSLAANAGEIKKALNADNSPPIFACRAWVNFDGTRDTTNTASTANTNRLIRASGNVASVLRNGLGDYTITFTTAMPNVNYVVNGTASTGANNLACISQWFGDAAQNDDTKVRILVSYANTLVYDTKYVHLAVFA